MIRPARTEATLPARPLAKPTHETAEALSPGRPSPGPRMLWRRPCHPCDGQGGPKRVSAAGLKSERLCSMCEPQASGLVSRKVRVRIAADDEDAGPDRGHEDEDHVRAVGERAADVRDHLRTGWVIISGDDGKRSEGPRQ